MTFWTVLLTQIGNHNSLSTYTTRHSVGWRSCTCRSCKYSCQVQQPMLLCVYLVWFSKILCHCSNVLETTRDTRLGHITVSCTCMVRWYETRYKINSTIINQGASCVTKRLFQKNTVFGALIAQLMPQWIKQNSLLCYTLQPEVEVRITPHPLHA